MTIIIHGFSTTQDGKNRPLQLPDAWSYSRYELYERCPAAFAFKNIIKLPEPPSDAMARGNEIHKIAEKYIAGKIDYTIPAPLAKFESLFQFARDDGQFFVEEQWAFDKNWGVTGWFSRPPQKAAWFRGVVDAGRIYDEERHLLIIDHKTGKKYATNEDQVEVFAMTGMLRFPAVNTVETRLWYLDSGDEVVAEYDAKDKRDLMKKWSEKAAPMFKDELFPPRPNDKCRWCAFAKSAGGPCRFG